jgi:hypothetical protein
MRIWIAANLVLTLTAGNRGKNRYLNQSIHRQSFASPTSRDVSTTEISKKILNNRNSRQFEHATKADIFSSTSPATRNRYEFPEKGGVKHLRHGRNAGLPHRKTLDDEFGMRGGYGPRRRGLVEEQQAAGMIMIMSGRQRQRRGRRTPECLQRMRAHRAGHTRMPQSSPLTRVLWLHYSSVGFWMEGALHSHCARSSVAMADSAKGERRPKFFYTNTPFCP